MGHLSQEQDQHHWMLSHRIPLSLTWKHGYGGWATWWSRNCLDGRTQEAVVNSSMPKWTPVTSAVSEGSGLGMALFHVSVGSMGSGIEPPQRVSAGPELLVQ